MATRKVNMGSATIGGGGRLALIAGPCVIESERHARSLAEALARLANDLGLPFVFKASFDKANRSSLSGFRGPGLEKGLAVLAAIRRDLGLPVLSDIHSAEQARPAAEALDVIQIPAFLCRQTDLLLAAAAAGKPVNVKKGQFLAPWDMKNVVEKLAASGCRDVILTERGASFGYNNLVADMRSLAIMRGFGTPVIFDATHSAQLPGGKGSSSGGDRAMARVLARAAAAAGIDGLFLETHDHPDQALCDGPNMIPLAELKGLMETVLALDEAARRDDPSS
ncbi:MAG: 3-deoxy-8-phosphooctulonate synthase [Planctomycetota bacterium]|nr:3-deoxy-8-phosphooctulonate synthase [Planctomycetota bacterium]